MGHQRCNAQEEKIHNESINDCQVVLRVARREKQQDTHQERKTAHLLQREEKLGRDFSLERMQKWAEGKGLAAEDQNYAPIGHEQRKTAPARPAAHDVVVVT
jgi:hypothetical protein